MKLFLSTMAVVLSAISYGKITAHTNQYVLEQVLASDELNELEELNGLELIKVSVDRMTKEKADGGHPDASGKLFAISLQYSSYSALMKGCVVEARVTEEIIKDKIAYSRLTPVKLTSKCYSR